MPTSRIAALRPLRITRNYLKHAEGSALIEAGNTRVLCAASIEEGVPPFLRGTGGGWVTAEYGMLPRSTGTRSPREAVKGRQSGRTVEIGRLVGRSLRAAVELPKLGERTITIDCDVLQADGGTRCAAITGGMVALYDALRWLRARGRFKELPLRCFVAAVSAGIVGGKPTLDLCYEQDSAAEVDMNFVMTAAGRYVEIQGTAEREPFGERQLGQLRNLAAAGIKQLVRAQKKALRIE